MLLILAMNKVKAEAKQTLIDPFPVSAKRFGLKLEYLLTPEQKRVYYNHVLATLSNEIENTISQGPMVYQDVSAFTILRHLRDSVE